MLLPKNEELCVTLSRSRKIFLCYIELLCCFGRRVVVLLSSAGDGGGRVAYYWGGGEAGTDVASVEIHDLLCYVKLFSCFGRRVVVCCRREMMEVRCCMLLGARKDGSCRCLSSWSRVIAFVEHADSKWLLLDVASEWR